MDSELREQPARNKGARDSHDEIANEAKASALDELACKPAGGDADNQNDEKAFAGHVHLCVPTIRQSRYDATAVTQDSPERGQILCNIAQISFVLVEQVDRSAQTNVQFCSAMVDDSR